MLRSSLVLAALVLVVATAEADVYKTVDAQGEPHYSDQWSPGAVLIKSNTGRVEPSMPTSAPKSSSAPDSNKEATKQVQSDVQAVRAQQCKDLKAQYARELRARRIFQPSDDASSPKQYMTDADADAERVKTRQAMDEACADAGDSGT
jgi:Domain of unknown function (DUF4124)